MTQTIMSIASVCHCEYCSVTLLGVENKERRRNFPEAPHDWQLVNYMKDELRSCCDYCLALATHRFLSLNFLGSYCVSNLYFLSVVSVLHVCLHPAGLVWIASVIVGSPMLFVQQLEVSGALQSNPL